jgi:hypothetical protein
MENYKTVILHGEGILEFKQVELYKNYRKFMPSKHY